MGLWLFPWYQQNYRGDYAHTAAQIEAATQGYPLYTTDVSATGLSVTAHLDSSRYPAPYLRWPPSAVERWFCIELHAGRAIGAGRCELCARRQQTVFAVPR